MNLQKDGFLPVYNLRDSQIKLRYSIFSSKCKNQNHFWNLITVSFSSFAVSLFQECQRLLNHWTQSKCPLVRLGGFDCWTYLSILVLWKKRLFWLQLIMWISFLSSTSLESDIFIYAPRIILCYILSSF